jgi:AraC family transcriptional regulator
MRKPQKLIVNFKQQESSAQLFKRPALLTSHHLGWEGIRLEHHAPKMVDTPEHISTMHIISSKIPNSSAIYRWLDGKCQSEFRQRGSVAIIPADVVTRAATEKPCEFMLLLLDPAFFTQVAQEWVNPDRTQLIPHFAVQQDSLIHELCLALKNELESDGVGGRLYVDSVAMVLAVHLLRNYTTTAPQIRHYDGGLSPYRLQKVLDYIHDHLTTDLSLDAIAQHLGMSRYYFVRLFKQSMGMTPHQYVLQQRIEVAKQLLKHRGLTLSEIALRCGFADQNHLGKQFRKLVGVLPRAYRDEIG